MRSTMRNSDVEPSPLDLPAEVKGQLRCPRY
jgi:hypothetical protein